MKIKRKNITELNWVTPEKSIKQCFKRLGLVVIIICTFVLERESSLRKMREIESLAIKVLGD